MTYIDFLYGSKCPVALDESMQEHDDKYHNGHFDPSTQHCGKRDELNKVDDVSLQLQGKNDIISGKKSEGNGNGIHQRVPEEALRGLQEGVRLLHGAAAVAGELATECDTAPQPGENDRFSEEARLAGSRQEQAIEQWARQNGLWTDNFDIELNKRIKKKVEGGESMVYFPKGSKNVEKLITNSYYQQAIENIDRILLHNYVFPESAMTVKGFGKTRADWSNNVKKPMFVFHVEQPKVDIERGATEDEIKTHMNALGYHYEQPHKAWISNDGKIAIMDLHDENVVVSRGGNIVVIDADIRLNTPRLGFGGKYIPNK